MEQNRPNSALENALALAAAGIPVFPCKPDKSPAVAGGFKAATIDAVIIGRWWRRDPNFLIAVPTGSTSGLWIADADIDKQTNVPVGDQTLAVYGLATYRYRASTRSGGSHYIFAYEPGLPVSAVRRLPGVDVRGDRGYIIVWDTELVLLAKADKSLGHPPAELIAAIAKKPSQGKPPPQLLNASASPLLVELRKHADEVAAAPKGLRRTALNAAAFRIGKLIDGLTLREDLAAQTLREAALCTGLEPDEIDRTIAQAMQDARNHPKTAPQPDRMFANPGDKTDKTDNAAPQWPEPDMTLLHPVRAGAPPFPKHVLPDAITTWVEVSAEAKGAPFDYVACSVLAAISSLVGNRRWVSAWPGWQEPPVIWAMLVGAPSSNKSPGMDAALEPLREVELEIHRIAKSAFNETRENKPHGNKET